MSFQVYQGCYRADESDNIDMFVPCLSCKHCYQDCRDYRMRYKLTLIHSKDSRLTQVYSKW